MKAQMRRNERSISALLPRLSVTSGTAWVFCLATVAVCASGCQDPSSNGNAPNYLSLDEERLSKADPVAELRSVIRDRRLGFIGVSSLGLSYPGVDRPELLSSVGVRGYAKVSDYGKDWAVSDGAYEYVEIYNRLLSRHLRRLGQRTDKKTAPTPLEPEKLADADPVGDAEARLAARDMRFLGQRTSQGEFVPGMENRPRLVKRHGACYVDLKDMDGVMKIHVTEYLRIYNLLLVRYFRAAGEVKPDYGLFPE